jgi:hypothetical protein
MSLYRLERYCNGDGDPIDSSDVRSILCEIERIRKDEYNNGLNTAISLLEESYKDNIQYDLLQTLICGLENSRR